MLSVTVVVLFFGMVAGQLGLNETVTPAEFTNTVALPAIDDASVAVTVVLPALGRVITPFFPLATEATPLANVIVVAVPKLTAVPPLSTPVGCVPLGEFDAPEKVRLLSPV